MDLSNSTVKTPEAETETPTRIQVPAAKASPFSNGVLKRHAPLSHHHHPIVVSYKECLKNHAAALGGHALDGCGEFMPAPATNPADPTSLKCAACGCHRNFHRREPDEPPLLPSAVPALEYRPHHRHHPPPPPPPRGGNSGSSPNNSPSPPPISSAYYPASAPHMLLALSHAGDGGGGNPISAVINSSSRKRHRTKFSQDQKEKMLEFAEKVGWKMQRRDEDVINQFCSEIGVEKGVFKVWMHNNKNTFGKIKDQQQQQQQPLFPDIAAAPANGGAGINYGAIGAAAEGQFHHQGGNESKENVRGLDQLDDDDDDDDDDDNSSAHEILGTNGSSSS